MPFLRPMPFLRMSVLTLAFVVLASVVARAAEMPAPIHGVTFEEWAAANARIANNMDEKETLAVLDIDAAQFSEMSEAFTQAMKDDKSFDLTTVYGRAFSNPNAGRYATAKDKVKLVGKLATFEDYARVQGHLQAGVKAGVDPQEVLKEHGLTVFEFSQESAAWVRMLSGQMPSPVDVSIEEWHDALAKYEAEYTAQYAKRKP